MNLSLTDKFDLITKFLYISILSDDIDSGIYILFLNNPPLNSDILDVFKLLTNNFTR